MVEAEAAVAEEGAATIVEEMVTWLGSAPRGSETIEDSLVINKQQILYSFMNIEFFYPGL